MAEMQTYRAANYQTENWQADSHRWSCYQGIGGGDNDDAVADVERTDIQFRLAAAAAAATAVVAVFAQRKHMFALLFSCISSFFTLPCNFTLWCCCCSPSFSALTTVSQLSLSLSLSRHWMYKRDDRCWQQQQQQQFLHQTEPVVVVYRERWRWLSLPLLV